jgi:hypothetical protein
MARPHFYQLLLYQLWQIVNCKLPCQIHASACKGNSKYLNQPAVRQVHMNMLEINGQPIITQTINYKPV